MCKIRRIRQKSSAVRGDITAGSRVCSFPHKRHRLCKKTPEAAEGALVSSLLPGTAQYAVPVADTAAAAPLQKRRRLRSKTAADTRAEDAALTAAPRSALVAAVLGGTLQS